LIIGWPSRSAFPISRDNEGVDEVGRKTVEQGFSAESNLADRHIYSPSADGTPGIAPSPLRYSIKRPCAATNSSALTFFQHSRSSPVQLEIPWENPSAC
jgi:hypothetical protein